MKMEAIKIEQSTGNVFVGIGFDVSEDLFL